MAFYKGFSTIGANLPRTINPAPGKNAAPGSVLNPVLSGRKFRLTDQQLVVRDFLNAINTPKGQKVGQPEYGTSLWSFIFEPNTADVQNALSDEIRRIAAQDPRINLGYVRCYPQENGILLEVQIAVNPFNQTELITIFFDNSTNTADLQD